MKKIIILSHDGGEFGNQMWNHINISAYAIERNIPLYNDSLYEYIRSFPALPKSFISRIFSVLFHPTAVFRRNMLYVKIVRKIYKIFSIARQKLHHRQIIYSDAHGPITNLPPSQIDKDCDLSSYESNRVAYLAGMSGGVFRNPIGIMTHADTLRKQLSPVSIIEEKIRGVLHPLRERFSHIVGVHIRNTDYKTFKSGKYYVEIERVREIIDEYMRELSPNTQNTVFIFASDDVVQQKYFDGLNTVISSRDPVTDCFILSRCDAVLGADSTFGHLASYLGNIPHIIFKKEAIDWAYYRDKEKYFVNKYLTMMNSDSYNGLAK